MPGLCLAWLRTTGPGWLEQREGGREDDGLEMVKRGPDHIGSSESCKRHWLSDLSKMFAVRVGGRGESGVGAG